MKKFLRGILLGLLCVSLILSVCQASQASQPNKPPKGSPDKDNAKSGKTRKPPYHIVVNDTVKDDLSSLFVKAGTTVKLDLNGENFMSTIDSKWDMSVNLNFIFNGNANPIEGMTQIIKVGVGGQIQGSGGCYLDSLIEKPKSTKKKSNWIMDVITGKWVTKQPEVKTAYQGEFEIEGDLKLYNTDGKNTVSAIAMLQDDPSQWVSVFGNFLGNGDGGSRKIKLEVAVLSNDNVEVFVTFDNKRYGPFKGGLSSDWDLAKTKDTKKLPIWGVWTNVSPYESMPNIEKDLEDIKKGSSKKINYKTGDWLMMKEAKKDKNKDWVPGEPNPANEYKLLKVTKEDITYETGEIWPYPGSALFVPKDRSTYSLDLKELKSSFKPVRYPVQITYNSDTDTIIFPASGRMVRVRSINLTGVWSDEKDKIFPDISKPTSIQNGTWYKFVKDTEADSGNKGLSGANYNFIRVTSISDKDVRMDKGKANLYPISGDELMNLYDIESEIISRDGTKKKETMEDEYLAVSSYDKANGEAKFGAGKLYLVNPPALKGSWCTMSPAVNPPDVEKGAFKVKDSDGNIIEPPKGAQWILFDGEKRQFTWIENLKKPEGILVRKGSYRLVEGILDKQTLLELSDITGSFYPMSEKDSAEGFDDKEYMYGVMTFIASFNDKEFKMDSTSFIPIPKVQK